MAQPLVHIQSCQCSHCAHLPTQVFGHFPTPSVEKPGSYLMRGSLRDVTLSNHRSRLSVRWIVGGRYTYEAEGERFALEPGKFLILNDGQIYNSVTARGIVADAFTVSFDYSVFKDVYTALSQKEDWLLDNPFGTSQNSEIVFLVNAYRIEGEFQTLLKQFSRFSQGNMSLTALDESFYLLMRQLLTSQKKVLREVSHIPSAKKSTREELYRRISRAREFLRANADDELRIETVAAEANLSPFHFLRTYKKAFGVSPHQEILDIRLEKARNLMSLDKFSLGRIAMESGFGDLSSFSKAFRQRFGIVPSQFEKPSATADNSETHSNF